MNTSDTHIVTYYTYHDTPSWIPMLMTRKTNNSIASNHFKAIGTSTLPVRHQVSLSIRFINAWKKEPRQGGTPPVSR